MHWDDPKMRYLSMKWDSNIKHTQHTIIIRVSYRIFSAWAVGGKEKGGRERM